MSISNFAKIKVENPFLTLRFKGIGKVYGFILRFLTLLTRKGRWIFTCFFILFWRCFVISNKDLMINEEIRDKEVRVIGANGDQLGVMSSKEALNIAEQNGMDLVKIAPQATPPVCKIMDYGKYKFELAKRDRETKKNQKVVNIKEIRLSPSIDTNDFNTKVNHTLKFLKSGDKVKITVRFRGREVNHSSLGKVLLDKFAEAIEDVAVVEKNAKLEGKNMFMVIAPK